MKWSSSNRVNTQLEENHLTLGIQNIVFLEVRFCLGKSRHSYDILSMLGNNKMESHNDCNVQFRSETVIHKL